MLTQHPIFPARFAGGRLARLDVLRPTDLVRESYARYRRHDLRGVLALLSVDIEITQTVELPWGGRFFGHAGAREYFRRMSRHTDAVPEAILHVPAGDEVVVIGRLRGRTRASREGVDVIIVHLWTIHAGRIVRLAAFVDTPAMQEALASK